jgi:transcription elongation factor Elf1
MSEELKPCPFCGEREDLLTQIVFDEYRIRCGNCGATTDYTCYEDVNDVWNTRAEPDYKAKYEELKFALQVEENDNEYNCAEKDRLKKENERLKGALIDISNGCLVPPDGGSPTFDDLVECAKQALAPQIEGK